MLHFYSFNILLFQYFMHVQAGKGLQFEFALWPIAEQMQWSFIYASPSERFWKETTPERTGSRTELRLSVQKNFSRKFVILL